MLRMRDTAVSSLKTELHNVRCQRPEGSFRSSFMSSILIMLDLNRYNKSIVSNNMLILPTTKGRTQSLPLFYAVSIESMQILAWQHRSRHIASSQNIVLCNELLLIYLPQFSQHMPVVLVRRGLGV